MSTIGGGERKASKALVVSVTLHQAEEGNLHCPAPRGHTAMEAGSQQCRASQLSCSCCRIHSLPIIKPQPLTEPPKLNHSFRPDPAPTPNPEWRCSRAGHQGGGRKEPRDSRNLQSLHEQLQSLTVSATSLTG